MVRSVNQDARKKAFSAWLQEMVWRYEIDHDSVGTRTAEYGRRMGKRGGIFDKWWHGKALPNTESCLDIARFFEQPAERVLKAAGHAVKSPPNTYQEFIGQVERYQGWESREEYDALINALATVLTSDWQRLSAKESKWKLNADRALVSDWDVPQKAHFIADMVAFWDDERPKPAEHEDTPASRSPTGVHPRVGSRRK